MITKKLEYSILLQLRLNSYLCVLLEVTHKAKNSQLDNSYVLLQQ